MVYTINIEGDRVVLRDDEKEIAWASVGYIAEGNTVEINGIKITTDQTTYLTEEEMLRYLKGMLTR